jgi:hypothetical protein
MRPATRLSAQIPIMAIADTAGTKTAAASTTP